MSKSVEELFRGAPADATHYAKCCHYKVDGDTWMVHIDDNEWAKSDSMYNGQIKPSDIIARPQPKPWSGPEDGLPPVGEQIDIYDEDNHEWVACKVVYVGAHDGGSAVIGQGDDVIVYGYNNGDIRKPRTAAELRETAIRELMDIAQVDCRVTAARLVDAGFKREVA